MRGADYTAHSEWYVPFPKGHNFPALYPRTKKHIDPEEVIILSFLIKLLQD